MNAEQQAIIRSLIAAQVAVLEWGEVDCRDDEAAKEVIKNLRTCLKEIEKQIKKLQSL